MKGQDHMERTTLAPRALSWHRGIMLSPEGDTAGGGKGKGPDGGEDAKIGDMTRKELLDLVADTTNTAVTARLKRSEESITKKLDPINTWIAEQREAKKAAEEKAAADEAAKATGQGKAGEPAKVDPEVFKMRQEQEAMKRRLDAAEAEKKALEDKQRAREERSALEGALTANGVPASHVASLATHLLLVEKRIVRPAESPDQLTFRHTAKDGTETALPVEDGVKEFLKTDAGKAYLPPKQGVGGAGTGAILRGPAGNGQLTKQQQGRNELTAAILGGGGGG